LKTLCEALGASFGGTGPPSRTQRLRAGVRSLPHSLYLIACPLQPLPVACARGQRLSSALQPQRVQMFTNGCTEDVLWPVAQVQRRFPKRAYLMFSGRTE
jgi:hypothetical protein